MDSKRYYVSYVYTEPGNWGFNDTVLVSTDDSITIDTIKGLEETIKNDNNYINITILNWKRLD